MLGAAGKAVSKLPKAGKIATGLEKAAKTLSQSKKAVDLATKIDKTTDAIKAVRGVKQDIVKEKNFLDILDYFTLEHHLSNLGKGFDREQIVEIDAGTFGGDDRFCKAEPISQVIGNNIEDRHVVHSVQIICYTGQPIF